MPTSNGRNGSDAADRLSDECLLPRLHKLHHTQRNRAKEQQWKYGEPYQELAPLSSPKISSCNPDERQHNHGRGYARRQLHSSR
jgi:hypothetical protein